MVEEGSVRRAVLTQIDWWWNALFRRRLDGLTDDELWWEPAPDCWTLHDHGDGTFRYEWPPGSRGESTPPFTTIAWRLCHLTLLGLANWAMGMEGDAECQSKAYELEFPRGAVEAVDLLDQWWARWRAAVRSMTDDDLWRPLAQTALGVDAPAMRLGGDDPFVQHLLHQQREFIHHGAEISLLRDLYRARVGQP